MAALATPGLGAGPELNSSGGDITSELGSLLSDAFDSAVGGEDDIPGGEGGGDSSLPTEGAQDAPGGESPTLRTDNAPGNEPKPGEPQAQPTETGGYQVSPDGKSLMVPRTELASIQAARQFHQEVGQLFATPQDAQSAYLASSDLRAMGNDWLMGSEDAISGVLKHWAGGNHAQNPAVQQRYQQSFAKMAGMVPDVLKNLNPAAYQQHVTGMVSRAIEIAYEKAATTQNPEDLKRAQELDWGATGQYKTELPKADPMAQERQRLNQERQQFERQTQVAEQSAVQNFNRNAVEGAKFTQLGAEIDKMLAPVKDRYSETAFADLKTGIHRELIDAISGKNDPSGVKAAWWLEHEQTFRGLIQDYKQSWRNGQPGTGLQPRVQAYINDFLNQAKRILPSIAKPRIEGTRTRTRQPGQPAANQPQARSAASGAQPQSAPQPGESKSQQWDREWNSMWSTASRS